VDVVWSIDSLMNLVPGILAADQLEYETLALLAAMTTQPDATRIGHINTLYAGLKADAVLSLLDIFYIVAAHDAQAARLNWKNPGTFTITAVNSPTFTTDRGYTGASTKYLNTGWTPSSNAVQYTLNSCHFMVYDRTAAAGANTVIFGASVVTGTKYLSHTARWSDNLAYPALNDASTGSVANTTTNGIWIGDRGSSTALDLFRNGTQVGSTMSVTTTALPTIPVYILCYNNNGSPGGYITDEIGAFSLGAALGATKRTAFNNRIQTYMTAVGA
jgi:uncharacterized membrane protein